MSTSSTPPAARNRRRPGLCESPHVRFTHGRYQARLWLCPLWGQVSLGLYPSEERAAAAARAVLSAIGPDAALDPLTVWKAMAKAIAGKAVRPGVLPKYVYATRGRYFARFGKTDPAPLGPFPSPVTALLAAMDARIAAARGSRPGA